MIATATRYRARTRRPSRGYCIDPHDGARLPVHRTGVGETMPRFTGRPTSSAWPVSAYLGATRGGLDGIQIQKPWFDSLAPPPTLGDIQIQHPWYMQQQAGMGQVGSIISASFTALATVGTMWMQWDAQNRASKQAEHEEERYQARLLEQQQAAAAEQQRQQQELAAAIAAGQVVVAADGSLRQANGNGAGVAAPADDGGGKGFEIMLVLLPILAGVLLSGRR